MTDHPAKALRSTWLLDVCLCRHVAPPSTYFYLLADVSRTAPIAAALSPEPLGAGFGAWLAAAAIGRRPPAILTTVSAPPAADQPALRDWLRAHGVTWLSKPPTSSFGDPIAALSASAWRALAADRRSGHDPLPIPAAQARLDAWYRAQSGR